MAIATTDMSYVRELILERSAIVIDAEKEYLVQSRLEPVAKEAGLGSLEELVAKLQGTPYGHLHKRVVEAMTTNETSFFRDTAPFEALKVNVLPDLIAKRASQKNLNIWCGASSSGQEPYTIAMVIREHFPELLNWKLQFFATDISTEMLAKCREGKYSQLEVNRGLPAQLLVKYFTKKGLGWQISEDLRNLITFQEMNLSGTWPTFPKFDIIFIRNVLIYFDVETKKQILGKARLLLNPDGYFFLGGAETTLNLDDAFQRVAVSGTSCYRLREAENK